ncbi:MAG: hypothetical protein JW782_02060 [Candidatus Saganbacteria bacterium]|nr:hypothetical protein [Candidatus Saganbacteria bacterium]
MESGAAGNNGGKNVLSESKQILAEEKDILQRLNEGVGKLAEAMQKARVDEYTSMIIRPWKFFLINFAAGIFRGLGMAVGFTLVFAIVIYIITLLMKRMVDLPIIGMYIAELVKFVNQYLNQGITPAQ